MARVKRAIHARKKKNDYFKAAKGYRGGRGRLLRSVKNAVDRSRLYSYRDRKVKKRDFRKLWITRINATVRKYGISYSNFIYGLKLLDIELDRKTLAYLSLEEPETFGRIVETVKSRFAA